MDKRHLKKNGSEKTEHLHIEELNSAKREREKPIKWRQVRMTTKKPETLTWLKENEGWDTAIWAQLKIPEKVPVCLENVTKN